MGRRRVKKAVVCVAQLVAALITVHGLLSFLSYVYGLFDPSGKTLWLSVDLLSCFETILERDRQMDRQMDRIPLSISHATIAVLTVTSDNKKLSYR